MAADLELSLRHGHSGRLFVRLVEGGGYHVRAVIDGKEIARKDCSDWRAVERFRARMKTLLQPEDTVPTASGYHSAA